MSKMFQPVGPVDVWRDGVRIATLADGPPDDPAKEPKSFFPLPGEEATTGDRLILNALRRKLDAQAAYMKTPTVQTHRAFLDAIDHMNRVKENV